MTLPRPLPRRRDPRFTDRPRTRVLGRAAHAGGALLIASAVFASLLVRVTPAWSQAAPADDAHAKEVLKHFNLGNTLYNEAKYADALVEYDRAYEMSKNFKILYNRAQCLVMLKREPDAILAFEQYLKDGGAKIPADRRKEVEAEIEALKNRLGSVLIENAPPGSDVRIDKSYAGKTPLPGAIPAGAGTHDLVITPPGGGAPYVSTINVVAGSETVVRVEMAPGPVPAVAPPPPINTDLPPQPPPQPQLPPRAPGGLTSPSIQLAAQIGGVMPTDDYRLGERRPLGAGEISASYRLNGFWEFGLYAGGATGRYGIKPEGATKTEAATNPSTGQVIIDDKAAYSYATAGLRLRMHLVRTKAIDGWFGLDVGTWQETWKFTGAQAFDYKASAAAFGLAVGMDVPLSRNWAIGGSLRFLAASASNGKRSNCVRESSCATGLFLPGESNNSLVASQSTNRGFFELGLRVVYLIPLGPEPASPKATPTSASRSRVLF